MIHFLLDYKYIVVWKYFVTRVKDLNTLSTGENTCIHWSSGGK